MLQLLLCVIFSISFLRVFSFPDPGLWSGSYTKVNSAIFGHAKPLYAGSNVYVSVNCEPYSSDQKIELQWILRQTACFEDCLAVDIYNHPNFTENFACPLSTNYSPQVRYFVSKTIILDCSNRIQLQFTNVTLTPSSENFEILDLCPNLPYIKNAKYGNYSRISESNSIFPQSNSTLLRERRNAILNATTNGAKYLGAKHNLQPASVIKSSEVVSDEDVKKSFSAKEGSKVKITDNINNKAVKDDSYSSATLATPTHVKTGTKIATVDADGIYLFVLRVKSFTLEQPLFNITVDISMKGDTGFLSAVDYPLLLFYGIMCGLYVIYAIAWLVMSALQWRDLLRIQFWIGAVILLGLMEKAVFYAEYQSINFTGQSVQGAILFAEILSCMKRTLARMLIIIVSLGFGIVKPRLGPMLHRIIGVGALYFCLGTIEGCLRVLKPKADPGNQALMAGIPLAVTDSAICWWIFSSLVQTIRTLRLRRNIVKLQLYKHFTNTLLLSVIGSVAFMTWSIHAHKLVNCITDWKELWVDEAYWHFLFSVILFVIMILWRPTNNNQRYAFTPLLDAVDDEEEDEEENHLTNDAFVGMKMRTKNNSCASPKQESKNKQDEDLKWVEENIPTSLTDVALPSILDSDEEIMTAKFERSKME